MNRFALICILFAAVTHAQIADDSGYMRETQGAAAQSLMVLRQMVTADNFKDMGFASVDEVKEAGLGQPISVYLVRLDELREFKAGADPAALLRSLGKVIYPVTVRQQVRSAVTLERKDNQWRATEFGSPKLIALLDKMRGASAASSSTNLFVVHVAALSTYFLGYRSGTKVMLIPLVDNPEAHLTAGRTITAEEAFAALVPVAQQYNGLPM
jgi:hypothetical protein